MTDFQRTSKACDSAPLRTVPIQIVDRVLGASLDTPHGVLLAGAYRTESPDQAHREADHLLVYRNVERSPCALRLNSACFTGDLFGDVRCDCHWQLEYSLRYITQHDQGLLIYHMHHEGRANGILEKLRARKRGQALDHVAPYAEVGAPTDARRYESSVVILNDLGIRSVRLLTNSPQKRAALEAAGIEVVGTLPVKAPGPEYAGFYRWKREEYGHDV